MIGTASPYEVRHVHVFPLVWGSLRACWCGLVPVATPIGVRR